MSDPFSRIIPVLSALLGCAPASATAPPPVRVVQAEPTVGAEVAPRPAGVDESCKRLKLAPDAFVGFAVDVPIEQLGIALEALPPVRRLLGDFVCAARESVWPELLFVGNAERGCSPLVPSALERLELASPAGETALATVHTEGAARIAVPLQWTEQGWRLAPRAADVLCEPP